MTDTESTEEMPPILRVPGIKQRMQCSSQTARRVTDVFVDVKSLVDAVQGHDDLTKIDGIGPATAEVIEEWWDNRFERESKVGSGSVERTDSSTMTIHVHNSWEGFLDE
jgi:hypothetical protein